LIHFRGHRDHPTAEGDAGDRQRAAIGAAVGGLCVTLLIAAVNGAITLDEQESSATTLGALAFMVALAAPFLIVVLASILFETQLQRPIWLAGALLTLVLGGITIFSGIGVLFICVGGALLWDWWGARLGTAAGWQLKPALLSLLIVASLGSSLVFLWFRETPMCWGTSEGDSGWIASSSTGSGSELCASDIIDNTEAALSLTSIAVGLVGTWLIVSRWNAVK